MEAMHGLPCTHHQMQQPDWHNSCHACTYSIWNWLMEGSTDLSVTYMWLAATVFAPRSCVSWAVFVHSLARNISIARPAQQSYSNAFTHTCLHFRRNIKALLVHTSHITILRFVAYGQTIDSKGPHRSRQGWLVISFPHHHPFASSS